MNVLQFKKILEKYDDDTEVVINCSDYVYTPNIENINSININLDKIETEHMNNIVLIGGKDKVLMIG